MTAVTPPEPVRPVDAAADPVPVSAGDLVPALRAAFQAVLDEPIPPDLALLAAELERRLPPSGSDGGA